MVESERIELILTAQNQVSEKIDEVIKSLQSVKKQGKETEGGLSDMAKQVGLAFGKYMGPAALVAGLTVAVKEAMEAEVALNNLKSAVETVGGSWEDLRKPLQDYAAKLQETTLFTDEQALDVMSRLVTVTGNSEVAWKNAGLVLDIASTGMMNAEGAARLVGMAMEGNVEALGRFVPELRGANLEIVKNKSAAEKAEYAMGILNDKFGGRASAQVNTTAGQFAILQKNLFELAEDIGTALLPYIEILSKSLNVLINIVRDGISAWKGFWKEMAGGDMKVEAANANAYADALEAMNRAQKSGVKNMEPFIKAVKEAKEEYNKSSKAVTGYGKAITGTSKLAGSASRDALKMIEDEQKKLVTAEENKRKAMMATTDYQVLSNNEKLENEIAFYKNLESKMDTSTKAYLDVVGKRKDVEIRYAEEAIKYTTDGWTKAYNEVMSKGYDFEKAFTAMYEGIKSGFSTSIESWISGATTFGDFMSSLANDVLSVWRKMLADMVAEWIAKGIMNLINDAFSATSGIGGAVNTALGATGGAGGVLGTVGAIAGSVGGAVSGAVGAIGAGVAALAPIALPVAAIAGIISMFPKETTAEEYKQKLQKAWDDWKSGISKPWGKTFSEGLAMVGGDKKALLDLLIVALGGGSFAYDGFKAQRDSIALASGGIVTSPTMALVGEEGPEAVIPLSKLGNMGGSGDVIIESGAFVIHGVNFSNEGQKRSVAQEIASYIFDYQNNTRPAYRRAI